jgi:26S proteasome regulatory subunit T4
MKTLDKDYTKTEDDMKALQSVGQIIGEVLKQLDHERCKSSARRRTESREWE